MSDGMIVDRGGEHRYKGAIRNDEGRLVGVTGWCKTFGHPEKVVHREGAILVPTVPIAELTEEERSDLRISMWSEKDLKSAIQKLIRRSHVQDALDVAYTLCGESSGLWWLAMRFPIFAVEDVGWEWLGVLGKDRLEEQEALEFVGQMAMTPKSQEAGAMHIMASSAPPEEGTTIGYVSAVLRTFKADGFDAAGAMLRRDVDTEFAEAVVDKALWRGSYRAMADDTRMLLVGAALAVADRIDQPPFERPDVPYEPATIRELPWWCFDAHSSVGRKALAPAAEEIGGDKRALADLWFVAESVKADPIREGARWLVESKEQWVREFGWRDLEQLEGRWAELRPIVQKHVERQIDKKREGSSQ